MPRHLLIRSRSSPPEPNSAASYSIVHQSQTPFLIRNAGAVNQNTVRNTFCSKAPNHTYKISRSYRTETSRDSERSFQDTGPFHTSPAFRAFRLTCVGIKMH